MKKKSASTPLAPWHSYALTALALMGAYWGVLQLEFLSWDDNVYVTDNILIRNLSGTGLYDIFRNFVMGNYHPLVILSYALEYAGVALNPKVYHFNNLLLHLGTTLLVLSLTYRLTQNRLMALMTALFFGLHPLRVESVAWVTERKDVLYGFFYLLALNMWVVFREKPSALKYAGILVVFILSCLSKGQAVTLPIAFLLIDIWRGKRLPDFKKDLWWWLTLIPSVGFGILAVYAQRYGGNIRSSEAFGVLEQILIGAGSMLFYLPKFILPYPLVPFYPYPHAPLEMWWYVMPILLLGLLGLTLYCFKMEKVLFVGLAFYLLHILPVAQFLPVGNAIAADRYFYIPGLGLAWISAWLLFRFLNNKQASIAGIGISLIWGFLTWKQVPIWKNTESFFHHIIEKDPSVDFAFVNLGRHLEKKNRKREAVDIYLSGIQNNPDYPDQYNDGGYTLSHLGKHDSALILLRKAIQLAPKMAEAYNNLGYAFSMMQQFDSSEVYLLKSISLNDQNETAFNNLGSTYSMMGRLPEAIQSYEKAIRLKPGYADAWNNLGSSYGMMGNNAKAMEYFQKALSINPEFGGAWFNAGIAWQTGGETDKAFEAYRKAARLGHEPAIQFLKSQGQSW